MCADVLTTASLRYFAARGSETRVTYAIVLLAVIEWKAWAVSTRHEEHATEALDPVRSRGRRSARARREWPERTRLDPRRSQRRVSAHRRPFDASHLRLRGADE